jgi:hypothetical protein
MTTWASSTAKLRGIRSPADEAQIEDTPLVVFCASDPYTRSVVLAAPGEDTNQEGSATEYHCVG